MNSNLINDDTDGERPADADWVAFQYLCGELAEEECRQFESCLQDDQLAREALARAVELTQAVGFIESESHRAAVHHEEAVVVHVRGGAWLRPGTWLAAAALACIGLMLIGHFSGRSPSLDLPTLSPGGQPLTSLGPPSLDSGELASLWVNTAEILVTTELLGDVDFTDDAFGEELLDGLGAVEVDVDRLQAPSWMMAALAVESAETQE